MPGGNEAQTALDVVGNESGIAWLSVALLFGFLLSVYGWGRLAAFYFPVSLLRLHSVSAVIGLGLLNVAGGWLNVAKLATTECLVVVMLGGLLFAGIDLIRRRPWARLFGRRKSPGHQRPQRRGSSSFPWPVMIALTVGTAAAALLSGTSVFNVDDDFQTYLPRAVRMAQTGTLAGNPFDTLGLDSLGSQSFFQGFFLPDVDVRMMHGFDAVGCFALALLLTAELAVWWRLPAAVGALAVVMVAAINPQSVNVSPLYSGVLVTMALLLFGAAVVTGLGSSRANLRHGQEFILALFVALLAALKLTLAFFAGLYLVLLYASALMTGVQRKVVMKSAATVALASLVFIAPWLLLHIPTFYRARDIAAPFADHAIIASKYPTLTAHDIPQLLSVRSLFWGDSIGSYHFVVLVCAGTALGAWIVWRWNRNRLQERGILSIAAAATAVVGTYLLNANLFSVDNAIRYSCPVLMAGSVMGLLFLLKFSRVQERRVSRQAVVVVCGLMVLTIAVFGKTFYGRIRRAAESRTLIAFPIKPAYARYCEMAIRHDRPYLQNLQAKLEPGAAALVWIAAPFHLDFSRNRLFTVSEPGLINPVNAFPAGISAAELQEYLTRWRIRYVWLQSPGAGMKTVESWKPQLAARAVVDRKLADYSIYFRETMAPFLAQSRSVHQDADMAIFDLGESSAVQTIPREQKSPMPPP